eukprot:3197827-Pleurochrysis_carterae.AAC.1
MTKDFLQREARAMLLRQALSHPPGCHSPSGFDVAFLQIEGHSQSLFQVRRGYLAPRLSSEFE